MIEVIGKCPVCGGLIAADVEESYGSAGELTEEELNEREKPRQASEFQRDPTVAASELGCPVPDWIRRRIRASGLAPVADEFGFTDEWPAPKLYPWYLDWFWVLVLLGIIAVIAAIGVVGYE